MNLSAVSRHRPSDPGGNPLSDLVAGLVDDAGLFPPEELDMAAAVMRHRQDLGRSSPAWSHRFVCPAHRLDELRDVLEPDDRFAVSVITELTPAAVSALAAEVAGDVRVSVVGLEGKLPPAGLVGVVAALEAAGRHRSTFVEVPIDSRPERAVEALTAARLSAKLRCGGTSAGLFPPIDWLAAAIGLCVRHAVPFKATAGLHRAVRHRDPAAGLTHHGFLNLLLAVAEAVEGGAHTAVAAALTSRDPAQLMAHACRLDAETVRRTRSIFVSYGSCSTAEPVADMIALGLLPGP